MASQSQLYSALIAAGCSASGATTGAAVGMAESGGNLTAHNAVPPDDSYGPWQINMIGTLGPVRRAEYGLSSNTQLYDLATSAKVASAISHNGANWSAWSTYTSGAYKKYLGANVAVTTGLSLPSIPNPLSGIEAPFQDFGKIVDAVQKTAAWISNSQNWLRILYVGGGVIVIMVGLDMFIQSSGPVQSAQKVAGNAIGGKALLAAAV